ncbi:hypothetical protein ACOSQ4_002391 [Xanthoceras sorbifolium]
MGVPNGGQTIHMDGEHPSLSEWASTFSVNGRGIYINQIETCLKEMTSSDAEFKITFYLFLLGSLLAPGTSNFVDIFQYVTNASRIGQPSVGAPSSTPASFMNWLIDATTIKGPSGHDHLF